MKKITIRQSCSGYLRLHLFSSFFLVSLADRFHDRLDVAVRYDLALFLKRSTNRKQWSAYKDVVLYPDDVAASQIGRRQRRDVQLFISPVVRFASFDFTPVERCQFSRFGLDHSIFRHVLDSLMVQERIRTLIHQPERYTCRDRAVWVQFSYRQIIKLMYGNRWTRFTSPWPGWPTENYTHQLILGPTFSLRDGRIQLVALIASTCYGHVMSRSSYYHLGLLVSRSKVSTHLSHGLMIVRPYIVTAQRDRATLICMSDLIMNNSRCCINTSVNEALVRLMVTRL